jgi:hypothetical protein
MRAVWTYWAAVTGSATASVSMALNPDRRYLVTGGLILTEGDDHARVYIGTVCIQTSSDVIACGVRDIDGDAGLGVTEFLAAHATSVTVKLKATGGKHRGEGVVYEL